VSQIVLRSRQHTACGHPIGRHRRTDEPDASPNDDKVIADERTNTSTEWPDSSKLLAAYGRVEIMQIKSRYYGKFATRLIITIHQKSRRVKMRVIVALIVAALAGNAVSLAAEQQKTPEIKMLTPAECALITKRSDNEFYVKGPVVIGGITMTESSLSKNGIILNGVDNFDVINRSCFNGKPA
jgi:hypothetical protein